MEAFPCTRLTWLLTFNNPWVTGKESIGAEKFFTLRIDFNQSAGDCQTESFGLSLDTAAIEVYADIIFTGYFKNIERLGYDMLKLEDWKIFGQIFFVDGDLSFSFVHDNTGNCRFPSTNSVNQFHES